MSDFTVTAKIGADISNFQNGISKATSGLKSLFSSSSGGAGLHRI
jgi:hypothetical protein